MYVRPLLWHTCTLNSVYSMYVCVCIYLCTHYNYVLLFFFMYIIYVYTFVRTYMCVSHVITAILQNEEIGSKCCYYLSTVLDTEHVFTQLYKQFTGSPHKMTKVTFLSSHVGSDKLKKVRMHLHITWSKSLKLQAALYISVFLRISHMYVCMNVKYVRMMWLFAV